MSIPTTPFKMILLAAPQDADLSQQLVRYLAPLQQAGLVELWEKRQIAPGTNRVQALQTALASADLILPLLSAAYLAQMSHADEEMQLLRQQLVKGGVPILPILLRECMWQYSPFGLMETLPRNGHPILSTHWAQVDDAFSQVAQELAAQIRTTDSEQNRQKWLATGRFTDSRDGQSYPVVEFLGKIWMTKNLNYPLPKGYQCYDQLATNGQEYGGLYTWDAAQEACPPGWHLMTGEEWKQLIDYFGGTHWAYKHLRPEGESPLNFVAGGKWSMYSQSFVYLNKTGFYWSSQAQNYNQAIYFMFDEGMGTLREIAVDKQTGASCRCVLDD
ncbi:MAG: FISUMP domain-containing protein [Bacteroidota bacterium]